MTSRLVRSVRQPVVSSGAATSDGVGLGADSVAGDPVSENPVDALQVVTLAHGQLSPVFPPSVVMMKRLPSASSLPDQAPIKQFKLVCLIPLLFRAQLTIPGCSCSVSSGLDLKSPWRL